MKRTLFPWLIVLLFTLVACTRDLVPTPIPEIAEVVVTPTDTPTAAAPPPTPAAEVAASTATPEPTATPTPEPTPEPTATDTAVPPATITITKPAAGAEIVVGQEVTFQGQIVPVPDEVLHVQIDVTGMEILSDIISVSPDNGNWSFTTTIDPQIVGPAQLTFELALEDVTATVPVILVPDIDSDDTFMILDRPTSGENSVAGYTFFFEGEVNNAIDETVTMAVLANECTVVAASQSFTLADGRWHGQVILPQELDGPSCAIAYTGTRGDVNAREARVPIIILPYADEDALILTLGNSGDIEFRAGEITTIFGVATNAPGNVVVYRLNLDLVGSSQLLASGTAPVDIFGYWEIDLELPDDVPTGPSLLTITMGTDDDYREVRKDVMVVP
jgi:hypothetical protein